MRAAADGPRRTCLGCRARKTQDRLSRLALAPGPDGPRVVWDPERTLGGRGAWLCADNPACLENALRKRALARAFRRKELREELGPAEAAGPRRRPA